jgi:aryl-alcohol dehydrogenase-like predicted oxidoreductase
MSRLREGKIRFIGLCEGNGETRRAHKVHPISAIQVEYSPFTLDSEDPKIDALRAARELGVTVFASREGTPDRQIRSSTSCLFLSKGGPS